jgi:Na+:H+ antiporter, NhaA family
MHDRLFTHRLELRGTQLRGHAEAIGLDVERFDRELRQGVYAGRVADDARSGAQSGVPSTPGFFVNGVIHLGSPTSAELGEAIASELPSKIIEPD